MHLGEERKHYKSGVLHKNLIGTLSNDNSTTKDKGKLAAALHIL